MCKHETASTRSRYVRESAELHCEIVCDECGVVIREVETVQGYWPVLKAAPAPPQAGRLRSLCHARPLSA